MRRTTTTLLVLATGLAATAANGQTLGIAPLADALTFARTRPDAGRHVLAVVRYADGAVTGVDLAALLGRPVADPIEILRSEGAQALRVRIAAAPESARLTVSATDLDLPVDLRDHHVAAGTNYPEHAGEAEVQDGPFLFAKLVQPTAPRATVSVGDALLDYEVELAFVTLGALAAGDVPETMGLVACNDYTDRATLLRHVDVWNPASGVGFTTGKSAPGYLPVGDLFVVPRDVRAFAAALELRLDVNGEPRQRAKVSEWIWDLDRILAETWARREVAWDHRGRTVSLLSPDGTIPDRTLVMAGTPAGTVFRGVDLGTRARGALGWIFGGWDVPLARRIVETYIRDARAAGTYLRPGDRVTIAVDRLGTLDNEIVP